MMPSARCVKKQLLVFAVERSGALNSRTLKACVKWQNPHLIIQENLNASCV